MYQVVLSAFICWHMIKFPHLSESNAGPFSFTCKHAQHPVREVVWWMLHRPHPRHDQLGPTGPPFNFVFCGWYGTFSDCWESLASHINSSFFCWACVYSNRCFFLAVQSSLVAIPWGETWLLTGGKTILNAKMSTCTGMVQYNTLYRKIVRWT